MNQLKLLLWIFWVVQVTQARADSFRILDEEREALQCRIDMISRSQSELLISTYIVRQDVIGLGLLHLMVAQAAKGVKVRLILDSFGNELPRSLLDYLSEKQIEIRLYNTVRILEFHTVFDRMHEKVMITDNLSIIVGGRNISQNYFKIDTLQNFLDRELYAESKKAVGELRQHFYTIWNHPKLTSKPKSTQLDDTKRAEWQRLMDEAWISLQTIASVTADSHRDWTKEGQTAEINATYDNYYRQKNGYYKPFDRKNRDGTHQLLALLDSAKSSIDIENPYFHPTRRWLKALQRAIDRGVKIRLLTNSVCTNDVLFMQAVYRRSRPKYLKMGIKIWEYTGKGTLHTKSIVIDSVITIIGSYNIHIVSQKNNAEVCLWVKDSAVGLQNLNLMNRYLTSAKFIEAQKPNLSNCRYEKNPVCSKRSVRFYIYVHSLAIPLSWIM